MRERNEKEDDHPRGISQFFKKEERSGVEMSPIQQQGHGGRSRWAEEVDLEERRDHKIVLEVGVLDQEAA